jgi:hypothetical protein
MQMSDDQGVDKTPVSREDYDRMEQIHMNNLWNYVQAYARACDFIGKNFGDQALRQFHVESGKQRAYPTLKLAAEKGVEKFMNILFQHMNNIGGEFTIEETDEEIVVSGKCGTGGRYVREVGGERNKEGIPYYCVHCPIWWEEMPKEFGLKMSFHIDDQGNDCAWRVKK